MIEACFGNAVVDIGAQRVQRHTAFAVPLGASDFCAVQALNGYQGIQVVFEIDADASPEDIEAVVAQSQKRSAVYDIVTNPTSVSVEVN